MRVLSAIFGLIIGIAFTSGGVLIALETAVPTYQSWQIMKNWQSTQATLTSVTGSENNTESTYRYSISGIEYQNDRVYLSSFKDNIGSYHQDMYQHLNWLKDNTLPVTIWYNPNDPIQSVIDREMRWGLFALMSGFCSIFILIGLVVCISCLRFTDQKDIRPKKPSLIQLRKQWKLRRSDSSYKEGFFDFCQQQVSIVNNLEQVKQESYAVTGSQPWLNKKEWRNNRIRSGAKKNMVAMWVFAIVWSGISTPILFVLEDEINKDNYAALLGLLFPLIGLFLLRKAWQMTREWNRFGIIELDMDPFPGSIGGHVGGSLLIKNIYATNTKFKVELECVYSYMSGTGDDRSRRENIKWAEGGGAKIVSAINGIRARFRFDVPDHLPEADILQGGDYYFWRLKITSDLKGIDLDRNYNIPVFKTQMQSKTIRHDISAQVEKVRENKAIESQAAISRGDFESTLLARALRYKSKGNKQSFYYPMFRNKVLTLFALTFGVGFGFAAFSINPGFEDFGLLDLVMIVFSLPFALVGLLGSIAAIYLPFNNLSVTLENRQIKAVRRLFIFPIKYNVIQGGDINEIEVKSTGSTGQGIKQIKHFKLIAHTKKFKKITIAEDLDGEDLANQLKDFICKQLFIKC